MIFIDKLKLHSFRKKWRKENMNNFTYPVNMFNDNFVKIGKGTYGPIDVLVSNNNSYLTIGNYCSIASNVKFLLSSEHNLYTISTYPFKSKYCSGNLEAISKGNIVIDDDVWIGYGAIILSGIHVGQGAVIAAGSVVTKDVPAYCIVAGNPAKIIRKRFSDEVVDYLLTNMNYACLDSTLIKNKVECLYTEINQYDVSDVSGFIEEILGGTK